MDLAAVRADYNATLAAFTTIAALQVTAHLWPPNAHVQDGAVYDYIVVGAGSAGSVVASRLSEDPQNRVLLMEAGGDPPFESLLPGLVSYFPNPTTDWNYMSTSGIAQQCLRQRSAPLIRARMLGGCHSINYMAYLRGSPHDYQQWADISNDSSWNWENILPHFNKAERLEDPALLSSPAGAFYGTKGNLGINRQPREEMNKYLDALKEVGNDIVLDVNTGNALGYLLPAFTIAQGRRQSTAYGYLRPAASRPNLHVLKNTLVTRVLFDESKRAVGVEAITEQNTTITIKATKEVVLSAGALNTPQLLMLSGIGPAEHLSELVIDVIADLPVGLNLQDHPGATLFLDMKNNTEVSSEPENPTEFQPVLLGFATVNQGQSYPDYEVEFFETQSPGAGVLCSILYQFKDEICEKVQSASAHNKVAYVILNNLHPESRGRVALRSTNPKDDPIVELGYYSNKTDLENMVNYVEDFLRVLNSTYFKSVGAELVSLDECGSRGDRSYWECYLLCLGTTQLHYSGTAALGSVVDGRLRVRGVSKLRVADASVMPVVPSGNINAAVIMVGEKAAHMIREDSERTST